MTEHDVLNVRGIIPRSTVHSVSFQHFPIDYLMIRRMQNDQQFVEFVVKAIVNHPNDVHAERTVDEKGVLITLKTHPEDMGFVIGKDGRTAEAIRRLLQIVGRRNEARVSMKIWEPEGSRGPRRPAAPAREEVDLSAVEDLKI